MAAIVLVSPAQHGWISVRTFPQIRPREASQAPQGGIGREKGFSAKEMDNSILNESVKGVQSAFCLTFCESRSEHLCL